MRQLLIVCIAVFFLSSCSENSTTVEEEESTPWTIIIESGNFAINTAPIILFEDSRSLSATNYYVYESDLPDADFEYFDIYVFIPMNDDINIYLDNIQGKARFEDSESSGNIYYSGESIQRGVVLFDDGQEYSQFLLTSRYLGERALNKDNFANYHITFDVQFVDVETDDVLYEIENFFTEVYKREQEI